MYRTRLGVILCFISIISCSSPTIEKQKTIGGNERDVIEHRRVQRAIVGGGDSQTGIGAGAHADSLSGKLRPIDAIRG